MLVKTALQTTWPDTCVHNLKCIFQKANLHCTFSNLYCYWHNWQCVSSDYLNQLWYDLMHVRLQEALVSQGMFITHYNDVIMDATASQITSIASVYSAVWLDADQRKHQSSAALAFVRGIHRRPVNSPHKGSVTRKMFPYYDVIMEDGCRNHLMNPLLTLLLTQKKKKKRLGTIAE